MYPDILKLGPLTIHSYGLFISIAFTFGILLATYRAKSRDIDVSMVLDMSIYAIVSAIVGSRIVYIIVNYKDYVNDPVRIFYIHQGGLVFYGGLIGVIITLSYYIRAHKLDFFKIADLLIPALPLGHMFGRIGCFLNGCCYGACTTSAFGVVFPGLHSPVPRHPTQLYESLFCISSLFFLLFIEKYLKKSGYLFVTYIYLYSAWRFSIEFLRDDDRGAFLFGLSPSQNISLVGVVFATALLVYITKKTAGTAIAAQNIGEKK